MELFEQKAVLESFEILIDTREQDTVRARRRYEAFKAPYRRATLSYGDYTYNAVLPSGRNIFDISSTIEPFCAVERKMDLTELAGCFGTERQRFEREFERAAGSGARMFLICENASWENLINGKYRSKMHPNAFTASAVAWMVRYGANLVFCKEETSSRMIREILYRDLKERLERGEFDE
ncbi:MAG: ERCC4 domain-containing protein [Clostridia bacterium]|nr:ERCC4 domain-containing protein [Clostridia bacterium]